MRRDFSLSHRGSIYSFLLRIRYTKLQCYSFETVLAQRAIRNYFNKGFINDKLLEILVKYHSIDKSIATLKRLIENCGLKDEIRDTDRNFSQSATEAGTLSGRIQSIHRLENWCEEKVV